ncbi:MAG: hypothetical protein J0H88_02865 [Sphingomonadales bacterium]|nr:hypothetical protein [Sphingomonadales bacterium]
MILLALLAMRGLGGISDLPPPEHELYFLFVHDEEEKDTDWKIQGSATTPTEWSRDIFNDIVKQCGGKKLHSGPSAGRQIAVMVKSGKDDLDIVRCVKASTSVRFAVRIQHREYGTTSWEKWPFRELWDR